jgi:hypothetical protein
MVDSGWLSSLLNDQQIIGRKESQGMSEAIVVPDANSRTADQQPIAATGRSFDVHEWATVATAFTRMMKPGMYWKDPDLPSRQEQVERQQKPQCSCPQCPRGYFESDGRRYLILTRVCMT